MDVEEEEGALGESLVALEDEDEGGDVDGEAHEEAEAVIEGEDAVPVKRLVALRLRPRARIAPISHLYPHVTLATMDFTVW